MKPIKITKEIQKQLKEYTSEPMNYDAIVNRLIHEVSDYMPIVAYDDNPVNIGLHEDTRDKLKSYRLTTGESYENILIRMLITSKTLNSSNE